MLLESKHLSWEITAPTPAAGSQLGCSLRCLPPASPAPRPRPRPPHWPAGTELRAAHLVRGKKRLFWAFPVYHCPRGTSSPVLGASPLPRGRLTLLTPRSSRHLHCLQGKTARDRCAGAHNASVLKRAHSFCEIILFINVKDTGPLCSGPAEGDVGRSRCQVAPR